MTGGSARCSRNFRSRRNVTPMEISAAVVKELRDKTGAGMMDCKKALGEAGGDSTRPWIICVRKVLQPRRKKPDRVAADGAVGAYVHPGGKIGVLVEINCETDFVARTTEFQVLLKDIAMQVAAANPRYVRREEVSADEFEKEKRSIGSRLWRAANRKRSLIKSSKVKWSVFIPKFACWSNRLSKIPIRRFSISSTRPLPNLVKISKYAASRVIILAKAR